MSRLRLIDVQVDGAHLLHLGGAFAGVLTESAARSAAARWIANTVAGPRPAGSDGVVDLGGELIPVRDLPLPLLAPGAPSVLRRDDVRLLWQAVCARRRDDVAALHASRRLERHRLEAAIERARASAVPASPVASSDRDTEAELEAFKAAAQAYVRVESLVAALDELEPQVPPEALPLADMWEANSALLREREALGDHIDVDIEAAERRVNFARIGVAMSSVGLRQEARTELERRHRAVVEAETKLFEARRRERPRALAHYESAVAAERAALDEAGVDSYASFLLGMAVGETRNDEGTQQAAQEELVAAMRELELAQRTGHLPSREELEARSLELLARTRALLRREVGPDPAADLRAARVDPPMRAERLRDLVDILHAAGVDAGDDPMVAARAFLESPPSFNPERRAPVGTAPAPPAFDLGALERQHAEHGQLLQRLESEIAYLDVVRDTDLALLSPRDLARAVGAVLDAYRAGELLAGRLPLVLEGVLDGLETAALDMAVGVLAPAHDVQVIVVTDDPRVSRAIGDAGGTTVIWPDAERDMSRPSETGGAVASTS